MADAKKDEPKKKPRAPRLGRGLSSLMGTPVAVDPPATSHPASASASPGSTSPPAAPDGVPGSSRPVVGPPANGPGVAADAALASTDETPGGRAGLRHVPVKDIVPNRHQPREHFDPEALKGLAASIKADGVMQPVVLRKREQGGYELVAGERRWRAAGMAGLSAVPALVRELTDRQMAEWALIENLQREDLNPIERATAFQSLSDNHGLTQAQLAERLGLDRSTVTNLLRLLKLAGGVQAYVSLGTLSMSQARSIASIDDHEQQTLLAETAIRKGWSVRETEDAVRRANAASAGGPPLPQMKGAPRAAYLADLERQIAEQLSTKVKLKAGRKKGSGTLAIDFYSIDEFDQLMGRLGVTTG